MYLKQKKYLFGHRKGIGIFWPLPQFYFNFQGILECVETSQVTILEEIGEKFLHVFILDIFKGGLKTDKFVTKCHVQEKMRKIPKTDFNCRHDIQFENCWRQSFKLYISTMFQFQVDNANFQYNIIELQFDVIQIIMS